MRKITPVPGSLRLAREPTIPAVPDQPSRRLILNSGHFAAVSLPTFLALGFDGALDGPRSVMVALALSVIWLIALSSSFRANTKELLALGVVPAAARGAVTGLVAVSAVDSWVARSHVSPPALFAATLAILVLSSAWEAFWRRAIEPCQRVLIVGTGRNSVALVHEINESPKLPFEVVGVVDDGLAAAGDYPAAPLLGDIAHLPGILAEYLPDLVVLAVERDRPTTFGYLLDSASTGFRVLELPQFYEHALGRVPIRDLNRAWFMSVLHLYQRPHSRAVKRTFDVSVASAGLLLMAPSLLLTALLVRRTPGPVILRQTRIGEHGRPFTIFKFRTMREDAEAPGEALWASTSDPRVTRVGGLLRRLRIDELPQLWNVLRGDMSIVGPRPERPEFLARLQEEVPYWTRRHLIKPGVTGWAQVRRGYTADVDGSTDKLSFDLWYLRHRSLLVDLAICMQTVGTVLRGSAGPQELRAAPPKRVHGAVQSRVPGAAVPSPADGID